jgi:hypothetical protein
VDNNYLDLGMNKSGFVHTLPSGRLSAKGLPALNLDGARANIVVGRSGLVRCCIYFSIVRS